MQAEARAGLQRLEIVVLDNENRTRATLLDCRRHIVSIVRDLLPVAAGLARKGRPRLLAICQKVIAEQSKPASTEHHLRISRDE
jgi:hypothetical protein